MTVDQCSSWWPWLYYDSNWMVDHILLITMAAKSKCKLGSMNINDQMQMQIKHNWWMSMIINQRFMLSLTIILNNQQSTTNFMDWVWCCRLMVEFQVLKSLRIKVGPSVSTSPGHGQPGVFVAAQFWRLRFRSCRIELSREVLMSQNLRTGKCSKAYYTLGSHVAMSTSPHACSHE